MHPQGRKLTLLFATLAVVVLGVAGWIGWPWLQFWWRFEALGLNEQGFPEYRHRASGIVMVRLPGGTFWMGAQKDDPQGRNYDPEAEELEGPVHKVKLSPFLIGQFEVTGRQWNRVMGKESSRGVADERPVVYVCWDDIQEFEAKTGLVLPTEAQWEYACRSGGQGAYCFGDDVGTLGEYCWYAANAGTSRRPVGQKRPNAFGLHDMHGNVWELCEDRYSEDFYSSPEAAGPDPLCTSGRGRVFRGGCYGEDAWLCRSAACGFGGTRDADASRGFRVAAPCP